jgi:hypothetical protein
MGRPHLWLRHFCSLDEKPEDHRELSQVERHRDLRNKVLVRRENDGGDAGRQVGEAGNHQRDAQDPGKEPRLDDKNAKRKEPETPECPGDIVSVVVRVEKAQRQSVAGCAFGTKDELTYMRRFWPLACGLICWNLLSTAPEMK